ncbi:MAG: CvpA family protein [Candidatus Aureabacteria bacterium]|nr:CvpA family protein [Candidatus Auribacterota bacterium]
MVNLDILILVVLAVYMLIGVLRGLLQQSVALGALMAGVALGWLVSVLIPLAAPSHPIASARCTALLGTLVFVVVYLLCLRMGRRSVRERGLAFSKGPADRMLGALLALMKGLVILLPTIWFLGAIEEEWSAAHPRISGLWGGSVLVQFASAHNPLARVTAIRRCHGFLRAAHDPGARVGLHGMEAYEAVVRNQNYRAVRDDSRLEEQIRSGNIIEVLRDRRVSRLMNDGVFWRNVAAVRWESALERPPAPLADTAKAEPSGDVAPTEPAPPVPQAPPAGELATVVLIRGTTLKGKIVSEDQQGIVLDLYLDGGAMRMNVLREEIDRIERPSER